MSKGLLQRNAGFLYLSFIMSGLTSIVPQRFFAAAAPLHKTEWLSVTLLVGTLGSVGGVLAAHRWRFGQRARWVGLTLVAVLTVLLVGGLHARDLMAFCVAQIMTRVLANYVLQELDRRSVALAPQAARAANDQVGTGLRFLGMVLAPVWFGVVAVGWETNLLMLMLAAVCATSVWQCTRRPLPVSPIAGARAHLNAADLPMALAAICCVGGYYLLAANMLYLLTDVHGMQDAAGYAGGLITTVFASAVVSTMALGVANRGGLAPAFMLSGPAVMGPAALLLNWPQAVLPSVAFPAAAVLGVGFALFLLALRNHVSQQVAHGREGWVSLYNNVFNFSALVAFLLMTALVAVSRVTGVAYVQLVASGLGLLMVGSVAGTAAHKMLPRPLPAGSA